MSCFRLPGRVRVAALLGGLTLAACGVLPAGGAVPDGYLDQRILDGLDAPTSFAFLPDGRVILAERAGRLRLLTADFLDTATVYVEPDVRTTGEGGFGGLAVDPAWPARPYLYAAVTRTSSPTIALLRYCLAGELESPRGRQLEVFRREILLGDLPDSVSVHNGGDVAFDATGALLLSLGDDGVRCAAGDSTSSRGALLRLAVAGLPDSLPGGLVSDWRSLIPPDNPFAADTTRAALVYCFGLRNPFRFSVDSVEARVLIGDVGGSLYEEIDEARGGENFGWPLWEGASPRADLCGLAGRPAGVLPVGGYFHPDYGLTAITAGPLYRRTGAPLEFGPEYEGNVFFADFYAGWIRRLVPGGTSGFAPGDSAAGQPDSLNWATGLPGISCLRQGPDGGIYLVRLMDGDFRRLIHATATGVGVAEGRSPSRLAVRATGTPGVVFQFPPLPQAARLIVCDVLGRRLAAVELPRGTTEWRWNGRGERGQRLAAGACLARLGEAPGDVVRFLLRR